jgi:hypothetical protein
LENTSQAKVPAFLWVVIIALLAGMYSYAAYFDPTRPNKTVENFYQAYFSGDYDTVASNLSVFWATRLLPKYAEMKPAELLTNRAKIEKELSKAIAGAEKTNAAPKDIKIKVLKPYTKEGTSSAIVVYKFIQKSKEAGMEAAILIKEQGRFRIFTMTQVDAQSLAQIKAVDISELDTNFEQLLTTTK